MSCTISCPNTHTYRMWTGLSLEHALANGGGRQVDSRQPAASSKTAGWPSWVSWWVLRKSRALGGVQEPLGRREMLL